MSLQSCSLFSCWHLTITWWLIGVGTRGAPGACAPPPKFSVCSIYILYKFYILCPPQSKSLSYASVTGIVHNLGRKTRDIVSVCATSYTAIHFSYCRRGAEVESETESAQVHRAHKLEVLAASSCVCRLVWSCNNRLPAQWEQNSPG